MKTPAEREVELYGWPRVIEARDAEIARLQEQVETQLAETQRAWNERDGEKRGRLAAEAERGRLREAGNNLIRFFDATGLTTNFLGELRAALQKEPQP